MFFGVCKNYYWRRTSYCISCTLQVLLIETALFSHMWKHIPKDKRKKHKNWCDFCCATSPNFTSFQRRRMNRISSPGNMKKKFRVTRIPAEKSKYLGHLGSRRKTPQGLGFQTRLARRCFWVRSTIFFLLVVFLGTRMQVKKYLFRFFFLCSDLGPFTFFLVRRVTIPSLGLLKHEGDSASGFSDRSLVNTSHLEPQRTSFQMDGNAETQILHAMIWNHPIETTM